MQRAVATSSATLLFLVFTAGCRERKDEPAPAVTTAEPSPPPLPSPPPSTPPPAPPPLASAFGIGDESHASQLVSGFFDKEGDWRWTGAAFSVKLAVPPGAHEKGGVLHFSFTTPKARVAQQPTATVKAKLGSATVSKTFSGAGDHKLDLNVPASELGADPVVAEFSATKPFMPGGNDTRVLGVIATAIELTEK